MKKFVSVLAVLLCLSMLVVPFASHADTRSDVYNALKTVMPKEYHSRYLTQAKNLINQLTISDKQAKDVIALIEETKLTLEDVESIYTDEDREDNLKDGQSLHMYTLADRLYMLDQWDKAMTLLNLEYKFGDKKGAIHEEDIVCYVYDANGKMLIRLDGDITVDKTDAPESNVVYLVLAGAFVVLAGVAFVIARKKVSAR